jgi:hypothetical protein
MLTIRSVLLSYRRQTYTFCLFLIQISRIFYIEHLHKIIIEPQCVILHFDIKGIGFVHTTLNFGREHNIHHSSQQLNILLLYNITYYNVKFMWKITPFIL